MASPDCRGWASSSISCAAFICSPRTTFHRDHTKALPLDYRDPFNSAITFPQLVSESNVMALLLSVFSTQSGQANSSLSGASRSTAGEMIVPISRPHFLHFMLSGKDINALPQLSSLETLGRVYLIHHTCYSRVESKMQALTQSSRSAQYVFRRRLARQSLGVQPGFYPLLQLVERAQLELAHTLARDPEF